MHVGMVTAGLWRRRSVVRVSRASLNYKIEPKDKIRYIGSCTVHQYTFPVES